MDHQEAVQVQAVERYLLDELSPTDREQFEEHFFDCHACAAEVKAGAVLVANARAVFQDAAGRAAPQRSGWRAEIGGWLRAIRAPYAVAFAAVVLLLAAYQGLVRIPALETELARLRAPQAYPAFFLRAASRGDDQVIEIPRGAQFVGFSLDIPPGQAWSDYACEVVEESGRTVLSIAASAPASAGLPLNVLIRSSEMRPGRYALILRGRAGGSPAVELGRYRFTVQLK